MIKATILKTISGGIRKIQPNTLSNDEILPSNLFFPSSSFLHDFFVEYAHNEEHTHIRTILARTTHGLERAASPATIAIRGTGILQFLFIFLFTLLMMI